MLRVRVNALQYWRRVQGQKRLSNGEARRQIAYIPLMNVVSYLGYDAAASVGPETVFEARQARPPAVVLRLEPLVPNRVHAELSAPFIGGLLHFRIVVPGNVDENNREVAEIDSDDVICLSPWMDGPRCP